MRPNRVLQAYRESRPSFGIYVATPSTRLIEMLGFAGLDFIRIQYDDGPIGLESLHHMIHTAHAAGITPFVRVPEPDESLIHKVLLMGALGIIIPRVTGKEDVEAAVRAVKGPPLGERHVLPTSFSGGYGQAGYQEHLDWANENIMLSVQVETKRGIEALDEIVSVPGLDMVQSGRGDLSYEYGVPGQQFHPVVLEAERKMIEAGKRAGKITSVVYYPLRDTEQVGTVKERITQGVDCIALGGDRDIVQVFRRLLDDVRG